MNQHSTSIKYGIIAGIFMVIILMAVYFISAPKLASFWPTFVYVPLIFLMIWGGITVRKERGGFSNFREAFVAVFVISIIATLLFDTFGYILYKVIDPQLPAIIKQQTLETATAMMEKFGTPDEQMEEAMKKMEEQDYSPTIKSQLIRYASSILIGAIFSALIALFVKRPEERPQPKPSE